MDDLSFSDIMAIVVRQKKRLALLFALFAALAILFAMTWSNYRSTATVGIRDAEVSARVTDQDDRDGVVTRSPPDIRISKIEWQVKSVESLASIIDKFHLYPKSRADTPIDRLTEEMAKKIKVKLIGSPVANPAITQKISANDLGAIAFEISFDDKDPRVAQKVTDELVTRFMDEDIKLRRTQAQETSAFLDAQITALKATMAEQEQKIAAFKEANGTVGPEMLLFNQQAAASLSQNIQNIESQLTANEGVQGSIRAQLAVVPPYSRVLADGQVLTTPETQLKALEAQYATLAGRYSQDHPDIVKLRSQINALKAQIPGAAPLVDTAQLNAQINDTETSLKTARKTYSDTHPDVIALQAKLAALQSQRDAAKQSNPDGLKSDADNPAYLQLVAQLNAAKEQNKALTAQHKTLLAQQTTYHMAIAKNPSLMQEWTALTRDYDGVQARYKVLHEKKMNADMQAQMEADRKGQTLTLIVPPDLPEKTSPPRPLLLAAGLVVAAMASFGIVFLLQILRRNVTGVDHLTRLSGMAPLVVVPAIVTAAEIAKQRRLWIWSARGAAVLVALGVLYALVT